MPDPTTTGPPIRRPAHAGNVEYLRKQAKVLLRAYQANEPTAVLRMASVIPRLRSLALPRRRHDQDVKLADAQLVIARELGHSSWPALVREISTSPTMKAQS